MARVLGVDYGMRRVGLALSDPLGMVATPMEVVDVLSDKQAARRIRAVCEEHDVALVVVGMPLNMNGSHGGMADKVEEFVVRLKGMLQVPVRLWDERLSSSLVERVLLEADLSRSKRKKIRDKLAAQVILQGFLDSLASERAQILR